MLSNRGFAAGLVSVLVVAFGPVRISRAQPWDIFEDPLSGSVCDVINTDDAELVVLSDTGQLVIVTGADVTLVDTFVDVNNDVYFEGLPAGFIDFADDGDEYRTVWWVSLTGYVVHVDDFTGEPTPTNYFPSDLIGACDACYYWDDPTVCATPVDPEPSPSPVTINFCGSAGTSLAMTAFGLGVMGFVQRRRV